jgi:hypothetical protein
MFSISRHKVFDRLEEIRLGGMENGLDWVLDEIGAWMVELDKEEKAVTKYLDEQET